MLVYIKFHPHLKYFFYNLKDSLVKSFLARNSWGGGGKCGAKEKKEIGFVVPNFRKKRTFNVNMVKKNTVFYFIRDYRIRKKIYRKNAMARKLNIAKFESKKYTEQT